MGLKPTITLDTVAAMCHAANVEYCKGHGETNLHAPWDESTQSEKDVSINALRELILIPGFFNQPIAQISERTWQAWKDAKTAEGWVYGAVKDKEAKAHPCLVEFYDELPIYEKVKDQIYLAMTKMILDNYEVEI